MSMNCENAHLLVPSYLDGELTQQIRQRVEIHLESCDSCRENFVELEALRERMGQARISAAGQDKW